MSNLFEYAETTKRPKSGRKSGVSSTHKMARDYTAKHIEVLEGLDPVRRRPGMYIGSTDEYGLHQLAAEVIDNAMDEAVNGFASRIEVELAVDGTLTVRDNGRGIPVDPHPKAKNKSALEVILTTLHSGGKFGGKAYHTSGGLHGVGISVVNALSTWLDVEVVRDGARWSQRYVHGKPKGKLKKMGSAKNRRGTSITFLPDCEVFGEQRLRPDRVFAMARSKAYLYGDVEIRWHCDAGLVDGSETPATETLHFPDGLGDYLKELVGERGAVTPTPFAGAATFPRERGRVEWAIAWPEDGDGSLLSHCNTVATPDGGTHESGLRSALTKALKAYGELVGNRRATQITTDDVVGGALVLLSVFMREPQFFGQTKAKLTNSDATRLVENAVRDHFDHWLSGAPEAANSLLGAVIERAEERLRRRQERDVERKSAGRKARLPGKLADCSEASRDATEVFIVEGDSAGGSAKQARDRRIQAVLPLRGKILNVATAPQAKLRGNQELSDLVKALGCGLGDRFRAEDLRYGKVIIMTDADVDGAHIAALLMTFFYREIPGLIDSGHLYLAQPPLYRLTQGGTTHYARDDAHKDQLIKEAFDGRGKVDISRFKGLGEMPPAQLKDTTMDPAKRTLLRVTIPKNESKSTDRLVDDLMGRKPERRLAFIRENAHLVRELDF